MYDWLPNNIGLSLAEQQPHRHNHRNNSGRYQSQRNDTVSDLTADVREK